MNGDSVEPRLMSLRATPLTKLLAPLLHLDSPSRSTSRRVRYGSHQNKRRSSRSSSTSWLQMQSGMDLPKEIAARSRYGRVRSTATQLSRSGMMEKQY